MKSKLNEMNCWTEYAVNQHKLQFDYLSDCVYFIVFYYHLIYEFVYFIVIVCVFIFLVYFQNEIKNSYDRISNANVSEWYVRQ